MGAGAATIKRADRQAEGNGNENKEGTCAQKEREREISR